MSAPFRELFVELPAALFDALKGIGEAAVQKAQQSVTEHRPHLPTMRDAMASSAAVARALCDRFGWRHYELSRSPMHCETDLFVRRLCGHRDQFALDDRLFHLGPDEVIDALEDLNTKRRCFCVPRPQ